jgi:Sigma-70 region 2
MSRQPVLTAFEQYCIDLRSVRSNEPEDVLVEKARLGDSEAIVRLLSRALPGVLTLAYRYKVYLPHDGLEDLVSIGNLAMLECLHKALAKPNPVGFLVGCARVAIVDHVSRFSSLITKHSYDNPVPVV